MALHLFIPVVFPQFFQIGYDPNALSIDHLSLIGTIVQTLHFPESNHPLVQSLFHHSDQELLTLFQNYPDQGKHFTAIFCRYGLIVHTLIRHSVKSPVQADYLFAQTWRSIFYELRGLNLREGSEGASHLTLQNWLINMTALCINQTELPAVESIHYSLEKASPPLWCYVQQSLDQLPPQLRLVVLMAQTFRWSESRIAAYLQAEGEPISPAQVGSLLREGYQILEENLPEDIRTIYLESVSAVTQLKSEPHLVTTPDL